MYRQGGKGFSPLDSCKKAKQISPPLHTNVYNSSAANSRLRHKKILTVHCFEDDISSIGAHPEYLTFITNLG